jgi:hypothetical protein
MPLQEIVISHYADPDFGSLELVETRTEAAVNGGPMMPLVFRQWTGKRAELDATISISNGETPPVVADEIRASFRGIVSNVQDFKQRVARSELGLAKDWIAAADMDLRLDERIFADSLKIECFTVSPGRLTVWLGEKMDIFGGHWLEVRIERGEIIEICLAG